jgi:hypothetical protein
VPLITQVEESDSAAGSAGETVQLVIGPPALFGVTGEIAARFGNTYGEPVYVIAGTISSTVKVS